VLLLLALACTKDGTTPIDTQPPVEICDDNTDNDVDGAIDCDDDDCDGHSACIPTEETDCTDGVDEDLDGATDCEDSDCHDQCPEVDCGDGFDNDGDSAIDCADSDCAGTEACLEDCTDRRDNDNDGLVDCDDVEDCEDECVEDCTDGIDNDQDGFTDCADFDDCTELCAEDCTNGVDDDADTFVDCLDDECSELEVCWEICDDGVDNDVDGLTDCEDADCVEDAACAEDCSNEIDDDFDTYVDCEDDECWGMPACVDVTLQVTDGSSSFEKGSRSVLSFSLSGYTFYSSSFETFTARDVRGTAKVSWSASSVQDCNWSVDSATFVASGTYYLASTMALTNRSGFTSSGGCGMTSGALPGGLFAKPNGHAHIPGSAAGSYGELWYGGAVTYNYVTTVNSTTFPGTFTFIQRNSTIRQFDRDPIYGSSWTTTGIE
jgi:hypothetical protein